MAEKNLKQPTGSTSALPDRALRSIAEDFLNRALFADALTEQILSAPTGQTLRLGVYGGWGEGKTSVLELMRLRLETAKQICVWITPWTAATRDEVMGQIVDQLRERLAIDAKSLTRAKRFAWLAGATTTAAQDASWWSKAAAQLFAPAVRRRFEAAATRESERFFEVVQERLEGRRVIVFIDDIDRVKPEVVPDLLLTLREALDQPNFFYVMALAPEIVERGLRMIHHGWGTAGDFLEKIVEYPCYLPDPTDDDIEFFIRRSIETLDHAIDAAVIQQLVPILPRNPRKLKLYLRFMASLRLLLERFDRAEIDLHMLYTVQLLRSEFPEEARAIARDENALEDLTSGHILELMKNKHQTTQEKPAKPSTKYLAATTSDGRKERFDRLYQTVRSRDALLRGAYPIAALFTLPDAAPLFTWKELNAFVPRFAAAAPDVRRSLLEAELLLNGMVDHYRARAFFGLILQIREAALGQASEALLDSDRAQLLSEASTLADILEILVHDLGVFQHQVLPIESWKALFAQAQRWAHFAQPDDYAALRARERGLVAAAVETMTDELRTAALDSLGPSVDLELAFAGNETNTFRTFLGDLRRKLEQWAITAVLRHFEEADGLERYWGDRSAGMKNVLFNDSSALFRDKNNRAAFEALATQASSMPVVQQNFVQFTRMLFYGAIEGGSFGSDATRRIVQDKELMTVIWSAALATPLNPRMAGGLREKRLRLIREGIIDQAYADAALTIPSWWQVLEGSFFKA